MSSILSPFRPRLVHQIDVILSFILEERGFNFGQFSEFENEIVSVSKPNNYLILGVL